jgi:hypothetical protein
MGRSGVCAQTLRDMKKANVFLQEDARSFRDLSFFSELNSLKRSLSVPA